MSTENTDTELPSIPGGEPEGTKPADSQQGGWRAHRARRNADRHLRCHDRTGQKIQEDAGGALVIETFR
jgi:hypothetical protein